MSAEPYVTHNMGDGYRSPCGLPPAAVYQGFHAGFTTDWTEVDCPACLAHHTNSRTSETFQPDDEPAFLLAARANARLSTPTSPLIVKALLDHIDALTKKLDNSRTSGTNEPTVRTSHVKWINVSRDDSGNINGHNVIRCDCPAPWRHLP